MGVPKENVKPTQGYVGFAQLRHLMHVCLEKARRAERDWNQGLSETRAQYPSMPASAAEIKWAESFKAKTLYSTGMREHTKAQTYGIAALVEAKALDLEGE